MPLEYKIPDWAKHADFTVSIDGPAHTTTRVGSWLGLMKYILDMYDNPTEEQVQYIVGPFHKAEHWERGSDGQPWLFLVEHEPLQFTMRVERITNVGPHVQH